MSQNLSDAMKPVVFPLILLVAPVLPANADGLALGGYDAVAYDSGNAVPGRREIMTMWRGKLWHFASEENRNSFEANPREFTPEFGGLCPVSLANGRETTGNPRLFAVIDGRLYLLRSRSDLRELREAPGEILTKANEHWAQHK